MQTYFISFKGHFVLLPITIGSRCAVGVKSVVVAGAVMVRIPHDAS
jgi:serine acetyltransferase